MKALFLVTSLSFLLLFVSCREDDFDVLPRESQEGLNTFGCIIDGELLVPKDGKATSLGQIGIAYGITISMGEYDSATNSVEYLSLKAGNLPDKGGDIITITITDLTGIGNYQFGKSNGSTGIDGPPWSSSLIMRRDKKGNRTDFLSIENAGELTITRWDYPDGIVSGTFSLKAANNEDSTNEIEVTLGVFDINWHTLNCGKDAWSQPCPE